MIKIIIGRKNIIRTILTSCLFLFVVGCGNTSYDTNTLVFNKDGSFDEYLVEDFDTTVYSFDEIKADTEEYILNYNASHKYSIQLTAIEVNDGVMRSTIKYSDDDAYYDFNNLPLFYGSVTKAIKAGYNLSDVVSEVSGGKSVNLEAGKEYLESKIIILNIGTDVNTYKDIKCISSNVKVSDDHKTATVEGTGTAYIVFD